MGDENRGHPAAAIYRDGHWVHHCLIDDTLLFGRRGGRPAVASATTTTNSCLNAAEDDQKGAAATMRIEVTWYLVVAVASTQHEGKRHYWFGREVGRAGSLGSGKVTGHCP
ncbi:hypothetical protein PIB30_040227 [Stylosanthes scabra]|uniref:Uncharacterized protein n=1 Tax=Stylosanthes scabra TaxID=79078 RepID=A0ABU6TFB9_9FABA|nr:hypothetical protein [Stylosanthes scabra]